VSDPALRPSNCLVIPCLRDNSRADRRPHSTPTPAPRRRRKGHQGAGTLEKRERRWRLAGRVRFSASIRHGHCSSGRRSRGGRCPAPEPELTDETRRAQGREAGRAELHGRFSDPALPRPALQSHGLAVGGIAGPAALGRRAPVRRGRLRVGCAGRSALGRIRTSARRSRHSRLAIHTERTSLTPDWHASARSGERASGSDHYPPVWRTAGARGKGHSAGSRLRVVPQQLELAEVGLTPSCLRDDCRGRSRWMPGSSHSV
jgi:hypothetical protein